MYYLPTDYLVLCAIRDKKTSLDALLGAACSTLSYPLSKDALAFGLGKLAAGGYIKDYSLTEKGVAFFKSNKKLLENKHKATMRQSEILCAEQVENVTPYDLSDAAYTEACDALRRKYSIPSPEFTLAQQENVLYLHLAGSYADPENEDDWRDGQSIAINQASLCALADAFLAHCEDGRHHKCCLYADGAPAYIATVSINDRATRLSICKILYNRQRFIGKRDSDLDYAQCGENIYDRTDWHLCDSLLVALIQAESALGDAFPYRAVKEMWEWD